MERWMLGRLRHWVVGQSTPRVGKKARRAFASVERLEDRITPDTTYLWRGFHGTNQWELADNWSVNGGPAQDYPRQTTDIAVLDGSGAASCTTQSVEDISKLTISGTISLTLGRDFRLENGGSMDAAQAVIHNNAASVHWEIKGGFFEYKDGNINNATADIQGDLQIDAGATFQVHTAGAPNPWSGSHHIGDSIETVEAGGLNPGGLLILGNSDTVYLDKGSFIGNSGTTEITTGGSPGPPTDTRPKLLANTGDPVQRFINNGTLKKDTSAAEYLIQDPIQDNGSVQVISGKLHVSGSDPATNTWSVNASGGSVIVTQGTTLQVDSEFLLQNGTFQGKGQGTATVDGKVQLGDGTHTGNFTVGDPGTGIGPTNVCNVTVTGNFDWENGTVTTVVNTDQNPQYGTLNVNGANGMTIQLLNTTLNGTFSGGAPNPNSMTVMHTALNNGIRNAPATGAPPGYNAPTVFPTSNYVVTKQGLRPRSVVARGGTTTRAGTAVTSAPPPVSDRPAPALPPGKIWFGSTRRIAEALVYALAAERAKHNPLVFVSVFDHIFAEL